MKRVLTARSVGNEIWVEGLNLNGQSLRWMFSQITSHSFHGGNFLSGDGGQTWRIQEELEARRMAWKTRTKSGKAQMARTQARPRASRQVTLQPYQIICRGCGNQMRMGHHSHRMVIKLQGCTQLTHHPSIGAAIRHFRSSTSQCDLTQDRKRCPVFRPKSDYSMRSNRYEI